MAIEYRADNLLCEWGNCTDRPTARLRLFTKAFGTGDYLYCQLHLATHINMVNDLNNKAKDHSQERNKTV